MNLRILICEDDVLVASMLKSYCEQLGHTILEVMGEFTDLSRYPLLRQLDLALMDINLGEGPDGVRMSEVLSANQVPVIFVSAYSDQHVVRRAMGVDPLGYLVKPFTKEQLNVQLEIAIGHLSKTTYLELNTGTSFVRLRCSDIVYLESVRNYVNVHTRNGNIVRHRGTLKAISDLLPGNRFHAVHRSFIVNEEHVVKYDGDNIFLEADQVIPIGRSYKPNLVFLKSF